MQALASSRFRTGDKVIIDSHGEFYSYVDGWRGRVVAVGPKRPTPCHSQIPEGYILVECERGDEAPKLIYVPYDHLQLSV